MTYKTLNGTAFHNKETRIILSMRVSLEPYQLQLLGLLGNFYLIEAWIRIQIYVISDINVLNYF